VCVSFMWYLPFYLQTKKKKLDTTINGLRPFKHREKFMISSLHGLNFCQVIRFSIIYVIFLITSPGLCLYQGRIGNLACFILWYFSFLYVVSLNFVLHYAVNKTSVVVMLFIAHLCSLFLMMVWVAVCLCLVFYSLYRCGLDISYIISFF
jgi:hypothetical protein